VNCRAFTLLLVVQLLASERPARACGSWELEDHTLGVSVYYQANAVDLITAPKERHPRKLIYVWQSRRRSRTEVRAANFRLMETPLDRRVEGIRESGRFLTFTSSGELRLQGRIVARLEGESLQIGSSRFMLRLTAMSASAGPGAWAVTVRRGETIEATALGAFGWCGQRQDRGDKGAREVRQRVALYLAWRELLRPRELPALGASAASRAP
jgi:hypothetical protein